MARGRGARRGGASVQVDRLVEGQDWSGVEAMLRSADCDASEVLPRLKAYARAVIAWNRSASNLVSGRDESRFAERHVLESLAGMRLARSSGAGRWVDLGSGAGLPAIPLAIAGIGREWTLVEMRRPKVLFLTKYLQESGLERINVVCSSFERWLDTVAATGPFEALSSRATLRLADTLGLASRCLADQGRVLAWKGSGWESEWKAASGRLQEWGLLEVERIPGSGCVVLMLGR